MTESRQRRALPYLVARIREVDPDCGIVLQGSVQHGVERPDSDIDLTIVLGDDVPTPDTDLLNERNEWSMIRVHDERFDVNLDINWQRATVLRRHFEENGAADWFIFSHGEIPSDPLGLAAACQEVGRRFFADHPSLARAWEAQNIEVARHKADPSHPLEFPTWAEFSRHLAAVEN